MSPPAQPPRERPRPERDRLPPRRPPQDRRPRDDVQADRAGRCHAQRHPRQLPAQAPAGPGGQRPAHQPVALPGRPATCLRATLPRTASQAALWRACWPTGRELTVFTNPLPNSYQRFGCDEAPRYVSWSRQNRSQLVRIPQVKGDNCRMELRRARTPPATPIWPSAWCWPPGPDGIEHRIVLQAPGQQEPVRSAPARPQGLGLEMTARHAGRGRAGRRRGERLSAPACCRRS